MKNYLKHDEWKIIETGFVPEYNRNSESVMSIGNGRMGMRANFEEQYSGDTLQGNYIAGIYYPDKTRVGWWKIGYPEYFAKVLNAPNWIGINIEIEGESLDLAKCKVEDFRRELNMKEGYLERSFKATLSDGKQVEVISRRFLSIVDDEAGAIRYQLKALNFSGSIRVTPYIDADIMNEDANYDEKFWEGIENKNHKGEGYVTAMTRKTEFFVCTAMKYTILKNGKQKELDSVLNERNKYLENVVEIDVKENDELTILKYGAVVHSMNHSRHDLMNVAQKVLYTAFEKGFNKMMEEQREAWDQKWQKSDIQIEGDVAAQQGIRFNIFMLNQTYTGEDERLNIGPKGFTGEKYGGSTYWDTEAYCLPFYLRTSDVKVPRNLLVYRYKHVQKAIENAEKLGFTNGAALYPMVTMNGEESHNEWEITMEEIHRNGAIAHAIYNYINYTGDEHYLAEYGLEVLIAISRFWSQRVNWSEAKQKYVMLGVTGPNEYENNVNNNWYTSTMACWVMEYTMQAIDYVKRADHKRYKDIVEKCRFEENAETERWKEVINNMYFPYDDKKQIFLQQEGYLDKEQLTVDDIPEKEKPINQHWSWDRILRSCFIKQADVLQGIYFFEDKYEKDTIRRNYDFYEPRTVHESSLSPCVHSILAAELGYTEKAYEFYLRTARLDLDDYNNDTEDGCHVTSMAGTYMSVVEGFGGMRVRNGQLHFNPFIPPQWKSYSFMTLFRGWRIRVKVMAGKVFIWNHSGEEAKLYVAGKEYTIPAEEELSIGK
ncbi:MAG: glycoside hydrolase family 65 protein [Bacteroidales bacterium]|nr:glycoside hydrolase family 65 protein [Bacteroidales bacterium]